MNCRLLGICYLKAIAIIMPASKPLRFGPFLQDWQEKSINLEYIISTYNNS
ncbi:hypothetical protein N752_20915 [Desulforamulus aquiferis]|nr:hypothetical protein N752_20915 [Desulforamulus aquiferis]